MLQHCGNSTNIKKTSWDLCSGLQQCRYCRTEYEAVFKHGGDCRIKFTITIWKDLGQGPETEEWKSHLRSPSQLSCPTVQFNGGEIASVFQARGAEFSRNEAS